jgi:hypothetical protein
MQAYQGRIHPSQPRVFNHSLDWRFLLPLLTVDKTMVFFEDDVDFSQTLLHIGIPVTNQASFLDIGQRVPNDVDSLVLPFGVPLRWVGKEQADQIEFFRSMRKLMSDTGHLLVGFNNSGIYGLNDQTKYHSSKPHRVSSQLYEAGFKIIKVFGVMPTLNIPEYIFDLNAKPFYFTLQHRFKRKPIVLKLLQLLSYTPALTWLSDFLPCYFIVANG